MAQTNNKLEVHLDYAAGKALYRLNGSCYSSAEDVRKAIGNDRREVVCVWSGVFIKAEYDARHDAESNLFNILNSTTNIQKIKDFPAH